MKQHKFLLCNNISVNQLLHNMHQLINNLGNYSVFVPHDVCKMHEDKTWSLIQLFMDEREKTQYWAYFHEFICISFNFNQLVIFSPVMCLKTTLLWANCKGMLRDLHSTSWCETWTWKLYKLTGSSEWVGCQEYQFLGRSNYCIKFLNCILLFCHCHVNDVVQSSNKSYWHGVCSFWQLPSLQP